MKSPQLLALNQTLPIWKGIRREMWPDCLVCSCPALATLISVPSAVTPIGFQRGLWGHLVVEIVNTSQLVKTTRENAYPSESMLFSRTMAFRASEFAEGERKREGYTLIQIEERNRERGR